VSEGELLTGDGVTQGIVRIGDTVRRPLRPFSLTVQAYLAHLRDAGFAGAPLPFGVDEQGREMLSFVAGDVPRNPLPPETAGDEVLVALARLIRRLHEASAGWAPPPDAVWGGGMFVDRTSPRFRLHDGGWVVRHLELSGSAVMTCGFSIGNGRRESSPHDQLGRLRV